MLLAACKLAVMLEHLGGVHGGGSVGSVDGRHLEATSGRTPGAVGAVSFDHLIEIEDHQHHPSALRRPAFTKVTLRPRRRPIAGVATS